MVYNLDEIDNIMIDIGISCLLGSEEYTFICLTTMIKLAKNPHRLSFFLGIDMNKSTNFQLAKLNKIKELIPNIKIEYITTGLNRSSLSHGMVINKLYNLFTNPYCIISDNDIVIYKKNWDSILIKHMIDTNSVILGVPYDNIINKDKYQNFPCATFCILDRLKVLPLTTKG